MKPNRWPQTSFEACILRAILSVTTFPDVAQTPNQLAVSNALEASAQDQPRTGAAALVGAGNNQEVGYSSLGARFAASFALTGACS